MSHYKASEYQDRELGGVESHVEVDARSTAGQWRWLLTGSTC